MRTSARVSHTPFDFTLTFCEVQPLSEQDIQRAQQRAHREGPRPCPGRRAVADHSRASIAALQEQLRGFTESQDKPGWTNGPVH